MPNLAMGITTTQYDYPYMAAVVVIADQNQEDPPLI